MFFWAISNSFLRRIIFFFSISSAELNPYIRKSKNVGIQYCSREWLLLPSCLFFPFLFLVFASVSKYFLATFVAPGAANGTPRYRESGQLFLPAWFGIFSLEYLNACTFARSFSLPRIVFFFPPRYPRRSRKFKSGFVIIPDTLLHGISPGRKRHLSGRGGINLFVAACWQIDRQNFN